MSAFERDVVIIGGGHNGRACAAYLAKVARDHRRETFVDRVGIFRG